MNPLPSSGWDDLDREVLLAVTAKEFVTADTVAPLMPQVYVDGSLRLLMERGLIERRLVDGSVILYSATPVGRLAAAAQTAA